MFELVRERVSGHLERQRLSRIREMFPEVIKQTQASETLENKRVFKIQL